MRWILFCLLFSHSVSLLDAQPQELMSPSEAMTKAYQQKDYAEAVRLYRTAEQNENISADAALLAAVSAYQLGKGGIAKKLIAHAFLLNPITTVDSYDEELTGDMAATKFHRWFEAELFERVRSPKRDNQSSRYRINVGDFDNYVSSDVKYTSFIDIARDLMLRGNYKTAHSMYVRAFRISDKSELSLTRAAACAFAAGKEDWADAHMDAAFRRYPFAVITRLRLNDEFAPLLDDDHFTRWVGKHITGQFPSLNNVLIAEMDDIWDDFTLHRSLSTGDMPLKSEGVEFTAYISPVRRSYFSPITRGDQEARSKLDRLCARRLTNIFEECGVPGIDQIGDRIVQLQAMLKVGNMEDWKQWKPFLITAMENERIGGYAYARAYDESLARSGQEQYFGTYMYSTISGKGQSVFKYWPIKNMAEVDDRRRAIGLYSIEKSRKNSNVEWPPEEKVTAVHISNWDKQLPIQYSVFIQFKE